MGCVDAVPVLQDRDRRTIALTRRGKGRRSRGKGPAVDWQKMEKAKRREENEGVQVSGVQGPVIIAIIARDN